MPEKRKRNDDSSTEEPASKKQAITPEMYEELKAKNAKLEKRIAELEKRNTDAQELTQKQIEKFQERTADSEEKFEKVKKLISKLNEHKKDLEMWIRFQKLLSDDYKIKSDPFEHNPYLEEEFKDKITITKENYKSVEDEINQLMD